MRKWIFFKCVQHVSLEQCYLGIVSEITASHLLSATIAWERGSICVLSARDTDGPACQGSCSSVGRTASSRDCFIERSRSLETVRSLHQAIEVFANNKIAKGRHQWSIYIFHHRRPQWVLESRCRGFWFSEILLSRCLRQSWTKGLSTGPRSVGTAVRSTTLFG